MGAGGKGPSRRVILGGMVAAPLAAPVACGGPTTMGGAPPRGGEAYEAFELAELTVADLSQLQASGKKSAADLTRLYLDRIAALNTTGPELRAVIETNPDALAIAASLDKERADGRVRGPLHGIPVLLKDNVATADKMENTAGSFALVGHRPPRDAAVTAKLRTAGAVILGKANMSEWANIRSTRSTSGWSARGGLCRSPYVLDRNPCGSSSGSGVAASANLCAVAIGSETDGSIVCPASHSGLVGIKPTIGAVSRAGIIPISPTQDTAGPMTRTLADAIAVLAAIAGADPRDPGIDGAKADALAAALSAPITPRLAGVRLGILRSRFGFHAGVDAALEEALAALAKAGAVLLDPVEATAESEIGELELDVLLIELKAAMAAHLAELDPGAPKSLADLIAYNRENAATELVHFGQELFEMAAEKGPPDDSYREKVATLRRLCRGDGIDKTLAAHNLDAIVAPTNGPAWSTDLINGDHYVGGSSTLAAVAGYPSITIPAGAVGPLPIGLSIIGAAWSEPALCAIGLGIEGVLAARRPPTFISTLTV